MQIKPSLLNGSFRRSPSLKIKEPSFLSPLMFKSTNVPKKKKFLEEEFIIDETLSNILLLKYVSDVKIYIILIVTYCGVYGNVIQCFVHNTTLYRYFEIYVHTPPPPFYRMMNLQIGF